MGVTLVIPHSQEENVYQENTFWGESLTSTLCQLIRNWPFVYYMTKMVKMVGHVIAGKIFFSIAFSVHRNSFCFILLHKDIEKCGCSCLIL